MGEVRSRQVGDPQTSQRTAWRQTSVFVEALQIDAIIGVYPKEREQAQPLCIDLEVLLMAGLNKGAEDRLAGTLDYDWAVEQVRAVVAQAPVDLLETLADRLANAVLSHPLAEAVKLRIAKPQAIPGARAGGVVLEAGRAPAAISRPRQRWSAGRRDVRPWRS